MTTTGKSKKRSQPLGLIDPTSIDDLRRVFAMLRKPRNFKQFAQNFLIDKKARDEIIAGAHILRGDQVLEIGSGSGVLTQEMVKRAGRVVALDLDPYLLEVTRIVCAGAKNLELRLEDVRNINLPKLFCEREVTRAEDKEYIVVSNVPYYLTGYLLQLFLSSSCPPERMVLTLQKEVAEKILAPLGDYSLLTVSVRVFGEPSLLQIISRESFWPQPNVDSAVLKIERHKKPVVAPKDQKKFFRVVKAGFSARRKKLFNSLSGGLHISIDAAKEALKAAKIDPNVRAQEISIEKWAALSQIVQFEE